MDIEKLRDWETAVDNSETSPWTQDLPKVYPLGGDYYETTPEGPSRHWKFLRIMTGKPGSRWAYWFNKERSEAIADPIFNGDASHFIGMMGAPFSGKYPGVDAFAWVLISPRMYPPVEQKVYEEKPATRYEKSREVYDVDTQDTHQLP